MSILGKISILLFTGFLLLIFWAPSFAEKTVKFDESNGSLEFTLYATLHSPHGYVHKFKGTAAWNELKGFSSATGTLVFPASAMDTKNTARDKKMYEYCLETAKYPTITFVLDSVDKLPTTLTKNNSTSVDLIGKLTIKDVTQNVRIPVTFTLTGTTLRVLGDYRFNWKDYHVNDPSSFFLKLNKTMRLTWNIVVPLN